MGDRESKAALTRREALKLSAGVAGAAAFATPVVVGAFSAPALGQTPAVCDPATDSDAVEIEAAAGEKWNINCQIDDTDPDPDSPFNSPYGRYNSQRSDFGSDIGDVSIIFGYDNSTDNFRTDQSWYTIVAPNGYQCSATWAVSGPGPDDVGEGCDPSQVSQSVPPPTIGAGEDPSLENSAVGALPLPWCEFTNVGSDQCNNQFLELISLVCCFID